jgi:hypothetical protein
VVAQEINCAIHPIQFSISEAKIVKTIPKKTKDFAFIIPRELDTYIYTEEEPYFQDYQRSYYAVTMVKGGWDCMRHYEILANGCIPYFIDLEKCHEKTMLFLPKELILEAMNLPGVSYKKINHAIFDKAKYYEILNKLLEHTRKYLTLKSMADYILQQVNYTGSGKILFLSQDQVPDYMRNGTLAGLKQLLGDRVVDSPKIDHIYETYSGDIKQLYGKGISYTKVIEDIPVDREHIEDRIKNKEFDLIIYGSLHRGLPYHSIVKTYYSPEQVVYMCGEDNHICKFCKKYNYLPNIFLREFDALR